MALCNGDKLLRMVSELLDFQKMAVVKTQVHMQKVELSVLLRQQVDKFQMSAQEKTYQSSGWQPVDSIPSLPIFL